MDTFINEDKQIGERTFRMIVPLLALSDAVNTASRMESSGEAGKIQISEQFYEYIKNDYDANTGDKQKSEARER